ncbi:MAG: helix-turn-helix domain-containing protein, partial [Opitutae bacterium]|nr:helix-turn-helix domain-containing protein [Opitutae bacterium]
KRKGLSIREAAEHTKIRGDYLQKFEANSFDLSLPPLYIRGFVRSYARYLDLDAERFLQDYDAVLANEGKSVRRETREVYGRVDFGDSGEAGAASGGLSQAVMLKYGLFLGGAVVVLVVVSILVNALSSGSGKPAAPAKTAAAAPATPAPVDAAQTVTLIATDATRVKVVDETTGAVLLNTATLARGESKTFRKTGSLLITVEDRTKLRLEVNGRATEIPPFPDGNYGRFRLD